VPALAALAATATEAAAPLPCGTRTAATPFTAWGDKNLYFTLPGGSFESGLRGWTVSGGATTVAENEPWKVLSSSHSSALGLPPGAAATSPAMCIASDEDSVRFFYKSPGVSTAALRVTIHVVSGVNVADNQLTIDGGTAGWVVSPRIMMPDIRDASGRQTVTVGFDQVNGQADWLVDDVEVDPWKSM
jgi:hypothetical protein